ncbi:TetR/AcrR family transcriptional regulator [Spiractinospora alimapuensis]|uniref:TetR/AcrR family transcriptional regulator n=1 Tax=Spiractinospora alimapuensis TaxID=2820884 RepID=UPI001F3D23EB|nr:TetR/AcrR family transcriptional regulator [Spiractinospora alimapuensis]QVQ52739.1 TetR/AcrR family transcriptional regulator [Spiractinospora alimapuensis]
MSDDLGGPVAEGGGKGGAPRRLGRVERREQILDSAVRALVRRGGFAATNIDDVAAESGVTRMILYRHFDSKEDLFRAVLERAGERLHAATTLDGGIGEHSVPGMLSWAAADPDGFRLLFHHAARDPDYRGEIDELRAALTGTLSTHLGDAAVGPAWSDWAASLATTMTIEAIMAWLDAGQPDPELAAERVMGVIDGVFRSVGAA